VQYENYPLPELYRRPISAEISIMHFKALLATALLAAPAAVAARGTLGFAVGNTTPDNKCKTSSDYKRDFEAIKAQSEAKLIRTYSNTDQFGNPCDTATAILPAAKDAGLQVLLGMWPDGGSYNKEKKALVDAELESFGDTVYGITVGSEGIYRGTYSEKELLAWIEDMHKTFPNSLIGTADSWNGWANGSMDGIISSGIKLILANGFPYWQYQEIGNATKTFFATMSEALGHIQEVSGSLDDIHFMNGGKFWLSC
jgi:glucan 1,3-beta-glucosidase